MPLSPKVGEKIGRYLLQAELGRGGMAVVYRARDIALERDVAIKVMHSHLWGKREYATRFMREARAVAALRHDNIVEIFDFSEGGDGGPDALPGYIVSELLHGPTLREFIDSQGTPLPEVAAMIAYKLGQALSCAHHQGIIHRDIKPENVIIAEGGRLVLTDFGIARIIEGEAVTQTGAMLGSPAYMSPEQARGSKIDARSDLFSLGSVLYLLCTGKLPFPGKDPISTVLKVLDGNYDQPLQHNPRIGSRLDRIIRRLLQSTPQDRFAHAEEVLAQLEAFLNESGISEVDKELKDYFQSPGEYNGRLIPRVLYHSLEHARQAIDRGDILLALALCDRVIAHDPENSEALALIASLSAGVRGRNRLLLLGGGVGLAILGSVAFFLLSDTPRPVAPGRDGTTLSRVMLDGSQLDDQQLDHPPVDGESRDQEPADTIPSLRRPRVSTRPLRRVDAALPLVRAVPDAAVSPHQRTDMKSKSTYGDLIIRIGPWCDAFVDGKRVGSSPMVQPLKVKAGSHQVVCKQGDAGPVVKKTVTIIAGQRSVLQGMVVEKTLVKLRLQRGDGVAILGKSYHRDFTLEPKRYRVSLLKGTQTLFHEYVTISGQGCTLVDTPALGCQR